MRIGDIQLFWIKSTKAYTLVGKTLDTFIIEKCHVLKYFLFCEPIALLSAGSTAQISCERAIKYDIICILLYIIYSIRYYSLCLFIYTSKLLTSK